MNYSVRYRKGLDLVLKGLNLQVHGGEKVSSQLLERCTGLPGATMEWRTGAPMRSCPTGAGVVGAGSANWTGTIAWGLLDLPREFCNRLQHAM